MVSPTSLTRFFGLITRVLFAVIIACVAQAAPAQAANPTGPTSVALSSVPVTPVSAGQSVVFTGVVSLTAGGVVNAGTITFKDGATAISTAVTVDATGKATFTTTALAVGSHTITAAYTDPGALHNSVSAALTFVVDQPALLAATATPTNPSPGASVTFSMTVTVPATGGAVTSGAGHVKIFDNNGGATLAAAVAIDTSGHGTFSISTLAVGVHPITLLYSDASTFTSEADLTVTVSTTTTTVLTTSGTPSSFHGSVTLTATVTSSGGTPTGQVNFVEAGSTIGSQSLNGSGVAAFSTVNLGGGSHTITANYTGFGSFGASTSTAITQVVNPVASTTAIATPGSSVVGQSVALSATVSSATGTPGGTVTFKDGTSVLANVTLANGVAALNTTALGAGSHTITALYSGSSNFTSSSATTGSFLINSATTTTTLSASPTSAALGGAVTFTATVASSSGSAPTGTVTFSDSGTTVATGTLNGGQAVGTTTALALGSHTIIATYGGTSDYSASVSATGATVLVSAASTTTTLTASPSPASALGSATLTAVVLPSGGPTPTGSITFMDGGTTIGTAAVNGSGQASVTDSNLSVGTHSLSATYTGSGLAADGASTGTASLTVAAAASTTVVTGNPNPQLTPTNSITFTATVTGAGTPTGTVTFKNGTSSMGSATLSGGSASLSPTTLGTGTYAITATYGGDANNTGSVGSVSENVGAGASSVSLAAPVTAAPGQSVTLIATVSGSSPTGSVVFFDGGTSLNPGGAGVGGGGIAQFSTTTLSTGPHSITANYSGNLLSSTSSAKSVTIAKVASNTAVSVSSNPGIAGSPVTFTVGVTSGAGTASGQVNFLDGATVLNTTSLDGNGNASFATSSLAAGAHTITASYAGSSQNNASTSLALPFSVTTGAAPDFSLSTTISGVTMGAGQNTTLPLTINPAGFSGNVTITCVGLPAGATCVSSPPTVTVGGAPVNVSVLLTTTGAHTGSVAPSALRGIRRGALPVAGLLALLAFMRRRSWRKTAVGGFLALCVLAACGGGGGGSTLPSLSNGSGFGQSGPAVGTPTPLPGNTSTSTPVPGTPGNPTNDGSGTITAGTGQAGSISTNTTPSGAVLPNTIAPGTIVPGTLTPGTSSGPSGQTPAGTTTVALVATGSNGVAHPLNITVVITP